MLSLHIIISQRKISGLNSNVIILSMMIYVLNTHTFAKIISSLHTPGNRDILGSH